MHVFVCLFLCVFVLALILSVSLSLFCSLCLPLSLQDTIMYHGFACVYYLLLYYGFMSLHSSLSFYLSVFCVLVLVSYPCLFSCRCFGCVQSMCCCVLPVFLTCKVAYLYLQCLCLSPCLCLRLCLLLYVCFCACLVCLSLAGLAFWLALRIAPAEVKSRGPSSPFGLCLLGAQHAVPSDVLQHVTSAKLRPMCYFVGGVT